MYVLFYICGAAALLTNSTKHKPSNYRDCNPGLEFLIPGFGIVEFPIPGSRRDWRSIVKTTKIAKLVTVFWSIFELQLVCVRSCYGFSADVLQAVPLKVRHILLQLLLS